MHKTHAFEHVSSVDYILEASTVRTNNLKFLNWDFSIFLMSLNLKIKKSFKQSAVYFYQSNAIALFIYFESGVSNERWAAFSNA